MRRNTRTKRTTTKSVLRISRRDCFACLSLFPIVSVGQWPSSLFFAVHPNEVIVFFRRSQSFVMTAKLANRCILLRLPGWRIHRLGPVASLYYYSGVVTHRNYGGGLTFHLFSQAH